MIRPFTAICMLLAAGSGLYLYQQKHKSQVLERHIIETVSKTVAAQRRVLILTAEWDLLNDPERLAKLSDQFLKLRTMNPSQFASLDDLATRLPVPRALPVVPDHSTEEPGEADAVAETPLPVPPMLVPPPAPSPGQAPSLAAPAVTRPATPSPAAAPTASAAAPAPRVPASTPAQPAVAAARPAAATAAAARPVSAPMGQPAAPAVSSLGMARGGSAPPAPVPISASNNVFPTGGN